MAERSIFITACLINNNQILTNIDLSDILLRHYNDARTSNQNLKDLNNAYASRIVRRITREMVVNLIDNNDINQDIITIMNEVLQPAAARATSASSRASSRAAAPNAPSAPAAAPDAPDAPIASRTRSAIARNAAALLAASNLSGRDRLDRNIALSAAQLAVKAVNEKNKPPVQITPREQELINRIMSQPFTKVC